MELFDIAYDYFFEFYSSVSFYVHIIQTFVQLLVATI